MPERPKTSGWSFDRPPELVQLVDCQPAIFVPQEDDVARRTPQTRSDGLGAAQRLGMAQPLDLGIAGGKVVGHLGRGVGRAVVDNDQLEAGGQLGQDFEQFQHHPPSARTGHSGPAEAH